MRLALAASIALVAAGSGRALAEERDASLRVASELTVAVGDAAAVSVTVVPAAGRTVSADGPLRLTVGAGDGVALARRRYGRKDAADPAAESPRFELRLRAKAPGDHPLALEVRLWSCGAKVCRPVRLTATVMVHAVPPPPPASPPVSGPGGAG